MSHQNYAESIDSSHRRTVLIEILSEASCRLSGISVKPQTGTKKPSKSAKPPLTELDLSDKTGLHVCDDKPFGNNEIQT